MGNNAIIIRTVGCHQNNRAYDAERLAKRAVDELRSNGHSILSATVETGGSSIDVSQSDPSDPFRLPPITDPDSYGRAAYERYLYASGGKSLVSGAELPGFDKLDQAIKNAWIAAADPSAPRLAR